MGKGGREGCLGKGGRDVRVREREREVRVRRHKIGTCQPNLLIDVVHSCRESGLVRLIPREAPLPALGTPQTGQLSSENVVRRG